MSMRLEFLGTAGAMPTSAVLLPHAPLDRSGGPARELASDDAVVA
jgi:hypothetical protein